MQPTNQAVVPISMAELVLAAGAPQTVDLNVAYDHIITCVTVTPTAGVAGTFSLEDSESHYLILGPVPATGLVLPGLEIVLQSEASLTATITMAGHIKISGWRLNPSASTLFG